MIALPRDWWLNRALQLAAISGKKLNLSAQLPYKDIKDQEGRTEITTHPLLRLDITQEPCLGGYPQVWHLFDFSACKTGNLVWWWESVFLRGNFTGEKKESSAGILEEGEHGELDRNANGNRILVWLQLYKQLQTVPRQSVSFGEKNSRKQRWFLRWLERCACFELQKMGKSIMNMSLRVFTLEKKQDQGSGYEFLWAQRGEIMLGKSWRAVQRSEGLRQKKAHNKDLWYTPDHTHVSAAFSTGYCPAFLSIFMHLSKPMVYLHRNESLQVVPSSVRSPWRFKELYGSTASWNISHQHFPCSYTEFPDGLSFWLSQWYNISVFLMRRKEKKSQQKQSWGIFGSCLLYG